MKKTRLLPPVALNPVVVYRWILSTNVTPRRFLFFVSLFACSVQTSAQNPDVTIGSTYNLNLQRQNHHADAWILHNAEYLSGDDQLRYETTSQLFGARGIRFSYYQTRGIYFYAHESATTAGATFTPVPRMFIGNNGRIGIGTTAPLTKFQFMDGLAGGAPSGTTPTQGLLISGDNTGGALNLGIDATGSFYSWIQSRNRSNANLYNLALNPLGGNVGIGTSTPQSNLHVKSEGTNNVIIESTGAGARYSQLQFKDNNTTYGYVWVVPESQVMSIGKGGHQHINMRLDNDRVGIGTTSPDAKLAVNGDIHATEVRVTATVPGPDYVFEKDYNLPTLEEIKAYIDQHKHLPEVPSAKEMEEKGINVGEMNMILLRKIEELTLYVIEQRQEINALKKELNSSDLMGKKVEE